MAFLRKKFSADGGYWEIRIPKCKKGENCEILYGRAWTTTPATLLSIPLGGAAGPQKNYFPDTCVWMHECPLRAAQHGLAGLRAAPNACMLEVQ